MGSSKGVNRINWRVYARLQGSTRMRSGIQLRQMRVTLQVNVLRCALLTLVLVAGPSVALAQWLGYPTPGIPRLANGAPNMKARAPRTREASLTS